MPLEARDSFPSAADFVRLVSEVIDDLPHPLLVVLEQIRTAMPRLRQLRRH